MSVIRLDEVFLGGEDRELQVLTLAATLCIIQRNGASRYGDVSHNIINKRSLYQDLWQHKP